MSSAKRSQPRKAAPQALTAARYATLKRDVQQLTTRVERLTDQAKVEAVWQLGERIARERLDTQRGYHTVVLNDLARDLSMAARNLHYAVAFHREYKRVPKLPLSWGHYRALLSCSTAESRAHYQELAVAQGISSRALLRLIASDTREARGESGLKRPTTSSYLYLARVEQVVDGDTMDLRIDLGFHTERRGRFRLARIDCPELNQVDNRRGELETRPLHPGRAARDFVFNRLASAKTIVVKTERTDLHGRYVTHLFYTDREVSIDTCFKQGTYLNAELVDEGHAEITA